MCWAILGGAWEQPNNLQLLEEDIQRWQKRPNFGRQVLQHWNRLPEEDGESSTVSFLARVALRHVLPELVLASKSKRFAGDLKIYPANRISMIMILGIWFSEPHCLFPLKEHTSSPQEHKVCPLVLSFWKGFHRRVYLD